MREVFTAADDEAERIDPWWTYYKANGRNADALLAELRKPFLTHELP